MKVLVAIPFLVLAGCSMPEKETQPKEQVIEFDVFDKGLSSSESAQVVGELSAPAMLVANGVVAETGRHHVLGGREVFLGGLDSVLEIPLIRLAGHSAIREGVSVLDKDAAYVVDGWADMTGVDWRFNRDLAAKRASMVARIMREEGFENVSVGRAMVHPEKDLTYRKAVILKKKKGFSE